MWSDGRMDFSGAGSVVTSADGNIAYVPTRVGTLLALDTRTGEPIWSLSFGPIASTPALYQGSLIFGSDDGVVYCVRASTGEQLWGVETGNAVKSSPAVSADGVVFITGGATYLYAIAAASGAVLWSTSVASTNRDRLTYSLSSPILGSDGVVYVTNNDGGIVAMWEGAARPQVYCGPTPKPVPYRKPVNELVSWPQWHRDVGHTGTSPFYGPRFTNVTARWSAVVTTPGNGTVYSAPIIGLDNSIFFGSGDGGVYAHDRVTGARRWQYMPGGSVLGTPAASPNGLLFLASNDEYAYGMNASTGVVVWRQFINGTVFGSVTLGNDGTVYVGVSTGVLYGLAGATGAVTWTWKPAGATVGIFGSMTLSGAIAYIAVSCVFQGYIVQFDACTY